MSNHYKNRIFAIYKGDKFIDVGTSEELAKRLNMKENSIRWLASPENKRRDKCGNRTIAIILDDKEE